MRHVAYAVAVALLLSIPFATSVNAEIFGQHVSAMAPDHATAHGRLFGECVMEMATTGECTHHEGM